MRAFGGIYSSFLPPPPQSHCQVGWGISGKEMLLPGSVTWLEDGGACGPGDKRGMREGLRMGDRDLPQILLILPSQFKKFVVRSDKPRTFRLQSQPLGNWRMGRCFYPTF